MAKQDFKKSFSDENLYKKLKTKMSGKSSRTLSSISEVTQTERDNEYRLIVILKKSYL